MSPLHIAVYKQNTALIEVLLSDKRTDIEITSEIHGSPLHVACLVGSVKIVSLLLNYGALINAVNGTN